jgi:hypothetical protein
VYFQKFGSLIAKLSEKNLIILRIWTEDRCREVEQGRAGRETTKIGAK